MNTQRSGGSAGGPSRARLSCERLEGREIPSVGGGFTNGGLDATYFRDDNFQQPAFTRRDPRLDFDWGLVDKPGGSNSPGFRDVGADHYSIRWQGQLVGRFTETYTLSGFADDAFVVEVRPAGATAWTTVVNQPSYTGSGFSGSYPLVAGQPYDIRVAYRELYGNASARLEWASPSTPREVIDPLLETGMNNPDSSAAFTDLLKGARNSWGWNAPVDAAGWPSADTEYFFQESLNQGLGVDPLMAGRIQFRLTGKADVEIFGNVNDASLAFAYDPAGNTTAGSFLMQDRNNNCSTIRFRNTTRTGLPGGPAGFTDLQLLRPATPGGATPYPAGTLFTDAIKGYARHYTVVRHQYVANQQKDWSDRTPPGYFNQAGGTTTAATYPLPWDTTSSNGWSWEHKVMFANETGTDLMLSLPVLATGRGPADAQSYVVKLANLIRYGSDGVNPYTAPTDNPVYPPLNPNLRVYLELGNELWNWAGVFLTDNINLNKLVERAIAANDADFRAINYDNLSTVIDANGYYVSMNTWRYRMAVLRMTQVSDIFRGVFGDAAMPGTSADPRVRPVYEWMYANQEDTARTALVWADRYLNKADPASTYPGQARPVSYYLWGGGGASYYGANNPNGLTALLPNSGFEAAAVPAGYTPTPAGAGWAFAGPAGVARDGGPTDDIPAPFNGSQVGYVAGGGSLTAAITVPAAQTSDQYAVAFKALNRRAVGTGPDAQSLRVYLDFGTSRQVDLTASTFSQPYNYTPPAEGDIDGWKARNVSWTNSEYYYTKSVGLAPGSAHTVTILATGRPQEIAFLDDVRLTSVDAIFAGGMPGGGEATGQAAGANIRSSMNAAANWAAAFGLKHVAYEGGWSLGGDDGGSYVQLKAKYGDQRTGQVQGVFMDYYAEAGGAVNVLGTYAQLPSWTDYYAEQGLLAPGNYPIVRGIDSQASRLPAEPTNGIRLPAVLDRTTVTLADAASPSQGRIDRPAGWLSWNVVATRTGWYELAAVTSAGGTAVVMVDDKPAVTGPTGATLAGQVYLTRGLHAVRVQSAAGAFTVATISLTVQGAPAVPVIGSLTEQNGIARLGWAAVPGAAGYIVRYGTAVGQYTSVVDVGAATTKSVSGLTDDATYYFAVASYSQNGSESLSSVPRAVTALTEGSTGRLARWQFVGLAAAGATVPASAEADGTVTGVVAGPLTRGPQLTPAGGWVTENFPDRFASYGMNNTSPQTPADAVAQGSYYQFSVAPAAGRRLSLSVVWFQAWLSHYTASAGVMVRVSSDGVAFTDLALTGAYNTQAGLTASLAGVPWLQNSVATVTIRIYVYGVQNYGATGIGLGLGDALTVRGSVRSVPAVESVVVGDGSAQRSMVTRLTVAFNTLVTPAAGAFVVTPAGGGATVPVLWTAVDLDGRTVVTVTFPSGSVADGRWVLTVPAGSVAHRTGGGVTLAADAVTNFYRLFGDLDGDAKVDTADLGRFRRSFGRVAGDASYDPAADYDSNGVIDTPDLARFRQRFGRFLP